MEKRLTSASSIASAHKARSGGSIVLSCSLASPLAASERMLYDWQFTGREYRMSSAVPQRNSSQAMDRHRSEFPLFADCFPRCCQLRPSVWWIPDVRGHSTPAAKWKKKKKGKGQRMTNGWTCDQHSAAERMRRPFIDSSQSGGHPRTNPADRNGRRRT